MYALLGVCLLPLCIDVAHGNVIELFMERNVFRLFPNVSYGLEHSEENGHQCNTDGKKRVHHRLGENHLGYTPNRRRQEDTLNDAIRNHIQLGFVLVLGAHDSGAYNYGPGGSLNGIMGVWDSWVDNFFSYTSNSSSLVLLLDERDFRNQNYTKSKGDYLDNIVVNNMGAKPVDCVNLLGSSSYHKGRSKKISQAALSNLQAAGAGAGQDRQRRQLQQGN
jgi:hypothetical protein